MNSSLIRTLTCLRRVALPNMIPTSHIHLAYWKKTSPCFHFTGVFLGFKRVLCGNVSDNTGLGSVSTKEDRAETLQHLQTEIKPFLPFFFLVKLQESSSFHTKELQELSLLVQSLCHVDNEAFKTCSSSSDNRSENLIQTVQRPSRLHVKANAALMLFPTKLFSHQATERGRGASCN